MNEITTFLQHHKHKERTASGGIYGPRLRTHVRPQTPVSYEQDNCRANTPTNTTPLLALHCHPNDPVAGTVLLPNQTMTVLRLQFNRLNDRADTPAIYRANDRACTPTINRPTDRQALCLTTITTAAGTVLPPEQTPAASTCS